jgi:serine phosphatase RsbU (regulator of sigma subunit)/pSer/pThr/pTyr-binding forkhead associated (FHA) protein
MAYLEILKGDKPGRIDLTTERVVIGRNPDCGVVLSAQAVSRQHVQIVRDGGGYFIEDLQSRNGTFVNGTRVTGATPLLNHACIKIGDHLLTFHAGPTPEPEPPELDLIFTEEADQPSSIHSMLDASSSTWFDSPGVQPETKLRVLLEISQNLRSALRVDEVLQKILDSLFKIAPQADRGFILLMDESRNRLVPKAVKTRRETDDQSLRISRTIIQQAFFKCQAILLSDTPNNAEQPMSQSITDFRMRSVMCVPLLTRENKPLGIIQVYTEDRKNPFTQDDLDLLVSIANVASIAIENAKLHEDLMLQERLKRELQFARDVQRQFLPPTLPDVPGYSFYAYYEAAYSVGGDYYGFIDLPDERLAISLGDVAGKGIPAALMMAHLSSDIRFSAISTHDPAAAVGLVKRALVNAGLDDKLITLLFMVLDKRTHTLSIGNAGHLPPLLRLRDGSVQTIGEEVTGLPLGVNLESNYVYRSKRVVLDPGSIVLVYTDGVTEAMNPAEELFGSKRLEAILKNVPPDPSEAGEAVIREVKEFAAGRHQSDDITLLCFGRT